MKKMNELMKELGFNPNGSDSTKEAFIKHLIKASTGVDVMTPSEKREIAQHPEKFVQFKTPQQLSFDFGDAGASPKKSNKVS